MRRLVLCFLVVLACGQEKKEEKHEPVAVVKPPPAIESLAALAPADSVGYLELGPLGPLAGLIDVGLFESPSPFMQRAYRASDPTKPRAMVLRGEGYPVSLLWLKRGARLDREQAEDELMDLRAFGRRVVIHHLDEAFAPPNQPAPITRALPQGIVRGRFEVAGLQGILDRWVPAAGLLASFDMVDTFAFGLGVEKQRIVLRGEAMLNRPVLEGASSLPALLSAVPEGMPLVLGADVDVGKLARLFRPFTSGSLAAQLEAATILGRGYVVAVRPSMQGTEFIQIYGEADMGAYFARLRKLIETKIGGAAIRIHEPEDGVLEITPALADFKTAPPSSRHLAFAGAKDPAHMARVLKDRLVRNNFAHMRPRVEGEFVVTERPTEEAEVARFKELVCRPFGFELHRTVEPGTPTYAHYRRLFARTRSEHVPPRERAEADKKAKRFERGLRWYPVALHASDLAERAFNGWILCALDDAAITGSDLVDAWHAEAKGAPGEFWVRVEFKQAAMERLTKLTGTPGHLAILVGGAVAWAPELIDAIPRATRLPGQFSREAAIDLAGEIRAQGSRLRFAKEVPSPLFGLGETLTMMSQPLLPGGRMRIRVAQAGRRGVLAINTSDERVDIIVSRLKQEKARGDVRVELRADLEQFLAFLDDFRAKVGVVGGMDYPQAQPAKSEPTAVLRVHGGEQSFRLDASVDEEFVHRIRDHLLRRALREQLDRLHDRFPFTRAELQPDPWGNPFDLDDLEDGRIQVRSAGPDGKQETGDDIVRAVGPPRLDGRAWFRAYSALLRAGKLDELWAMHKGFEFKALMAASRYAQERIFDSEGYRELRRLSGREPHAMMADREFWNALRRRDARWLKDGRLKLEFVGEERVDDQQLIRIKFTRDGFEAETTAVIVHEDGAVRIHTPPNWLTNR